LEFEVLKHEGSELSFKVRGASPAFVNALRRAALSEVPVLAVEEVMFFENESSMHDEIIAHRLGLIPLTTPPGKYVMPSQCDCGSELGCPRCRLSLSLEAVAGEKPTTVYSGGLKSEDPEVQPVSSSIPIARLGPGKALRLEAYARLGVGLDHAKWQAASTASYRFTKFDKHKPENNEVVFTIESTGALPPSEIVAQAARILKSKVEKVSGQIRGEAV